MRINNIKHIITHDAIHKQHIQTIHLITSAATIQSTFLIIGMHTCTNKFIAKVHVLACTYIVLVYMCNYLGVNSYVFPLLTIS